MALREVGNIGELDVEWSIEEGIIQPMIKQLQQPASSLKRPSLRVGPYLSDIDVQLLPATIFSGITAPLQHLTLDNCIIDLQSPLYCYFISLSITGIPSLMAPSTSQWLDMLRTTPCLTSLQSESVFSPSESLLSVPDVHLPQLSKLYISGPFTQCSQFLYHIRYPVLHSFCVLLQAVHLGNVTSAPSLPSLLKRHLSNVEPFQICTTCLSHGSITLTNGLSLAAMGTENPFFEIELSRDSDKKYWSEPFHPLQALA
ncbi:hypothetical protein GALMADRAFT_228034 [Galerina marginata CBS 339.88]|uniref:F-box domain-containing protein n=1 Tax=Galerina marginata (strain CBS 339.88) TaxID=685588 RepID=A0A067SU58_GALM3|nr:hypothetical protein GALMADRAFT_228034 [Galerina marginata CBS 339.88]